MRIIRKEEKERKRVKKGSGIEENKTYKGKESKERERRMDREMKMSIVSKEERETLERNVEKKIRHARRKGV